MKIAFVSTQRTWGGGENVLAQLATGTKAAGNDIMVAAPASSAVHDWARDHQELECLALPGRGRSPRAMWQLRRWAAQSGADVVLLNDPHAITYAGAALAGLPKVRVGIKHTCFPVRSAWKYNRLLNQVVCVAEAARHECLTAGVAPSQLEVIHAGLDWQEPTDKAIAEAEQAYGPRPIGTKRVLAIGSLLPVKGFDTLIEAVAQSTGWNLWIAGEGPERANLEWQISRLGLNERVKLLGFRRDVIALLTGADAFASASHREGLSLVLVEAMRAGTPVVATPVGGNGEALQLTGPGASKVARAVLAGDPAAMATEIDAALADTSGNHARVAAAQQWASDHFTVERMTSEYLDLFQRLLHQRGNSSQAA